MSAPVQKKQKKISNKKSHLLQQPLVKMLRIMTEFFDLLVKKLKKCLNGLNLEFLELNHEFLGGNTTERALTICD